jgi:hypothetical protein
MSRSAVVSEAPGYPMERARERGTGKTATNISHGHMSRQPISPCAAILTQLSLCKELVSEESRKDKYYRSDKGGQS